VNSVRHIVEEESARDFLRRQAAALVPALKRRGFKPHGSAWMLTRREEEVRLRGEPAYPVDFYTVWFDKGEWCFKLEIALEINGFTRGLRQVGFKAFKTQQELLAYLQVHGLVKK